MAWRDPPLPAAYCGVWRRLSIIEPDGRVDRETLVLWLQTPRYHIDIRLPSDRPDLSGAGGPHDLILTDLLALARQEGFAGGNEFAGDRLAWRRRIDFACPEGPPDEGTMAATGPDRLTETGLHLPYTEEWERIDGADGPFSESVSDASPRRIHLRAGRWVALAEERRGPPPAPGALRRAAEAAATAGDRGALLAVLDCPISFAVIDDDGVARVRHSTHPWLEGTEMPLP